jgi:hypothetical protein
MPDPLGGGAGDMGAPTINAKKYRWWAPKPSCGEGGGFGLHLRFERCVINLHGYDRPNVVLLMGPTSLRFVLLYLMTFSWFMGHG